MDHAYYARRRRVNALMFGLTAFCAVVAAGSLLGILGYIGWQGFSALNWQFLVHLPKPVGETGGGIANAIVGSAEVVALAALIGAPVGVAGGVYLAEYGRGGRFAFCVRYAADVLNGVPSIVIGLFAYALVVKPMKHFSALSGSVALAFIMVPIVLRNTEEFLSLVPDTLREAGLALGLPRWKMVLRVVLPTAGRGILTGTLLAVARVSGETAPLIFTAFGNRFWGDGLLNPVATLPHTIFTYAIAPYDDWHKQAWAAALILMLFVLAVNAAARIWLRPAASGH